MDILEKEIAYFQMTPIQSIQVNICNSFCFGHCWNTDFNGGKISDSRCTIFKDLMKVSVIVRNEAGSQIVYTSLHFIN